MVVKTNRIEIIIELIVKSFKTVVSYSCGVANVESLFYMTENVHAFFVS